MARLLPLFPLQLVALPGNPVPLHIFEPRYREMIGEADANRTEFGLVLAKDGGIVNVGCTVTVESIVQSYPDGRFDMVGRARRRFHLLSVNDAEECLRGEVDFFVDDDLRPAAADLRAKAQRVCLDLHAALGDDTPKPIADPADSELSFRLAPVVNDLDFLDTILRTLSETRRLELIVETAPKYLERVQYVNRMKQATPTNGHGHKPKGLH